MLGEGVRYGEERIGGKENPHPGQESVEEGCGASPFGAEDEAEERLGIEIEESEDRERGEAHGKGEASYEMAERHAVVQALAYFDVEDTLGSDVEDVDGTEGESESEPVEPYIGIGYGYGRGEPDEREVARESVDEIFWSGEERELAELASCGEAFVTGYVFLQVEFVEIDEIVDVASGLTEYGAQGEANEVERTQEAECNLEESTAGGYGGVGPYNLTEFSETVEESGIDPCCAAEEDHEGDEDSDPSDGLQFARETMEEIEYDDDDKDGERNCGVELQ